MVADPDAFKATVQESLRRQAAAINTLAARGMAFWDYGNSFLLEAYRCACCVKNPMLRPKSHRCIDFMCMAALVLMSRQRKRASQLAVALSSSKLCFVCDFFACRVRVPRSTLLLSPYLSYLIIPLPRPIQL